MWVDVSGYVGRRCGLVVLFVLVVSQLVVVGLLSNLAPCA